MTSARPTCGAGAAVGPGVVDAPTEGDHRRMRKARREAHARSTEIDAARDAAVTAAFRAEIGAVVRSASPLLIAMLAVEGLTLDDAVGMLAPPIGWPNRPRLSGPNGVMPLHTHLLRHYLAGVPSIPGGYPLRQVSVHPLVNRRFERADGGYLRMEVVDHSLEIEAQVGPVSVSSRFGALRIVLDSDLPQTIFIACVGRLIEDVVDFDVWRGLRWRIVAIEEAVGMRGQSLLVAAGSVPYRLPWAR